MVRYFTGVILILVIVSAHAQTTSLSTGLWSDGTTWSTGAVPLATATVQVNHSVFIDQDITITTGDFFFGQAGAPDEYITDVSGGAAYTLTAITAGGVIDVLDGITTFEGAGNIDNSTLIVRAGATLILGGLTINNQTLVEVYGTLIINGDLNNFNNGTGDFNIYSGGYVQVNGNYTATIGSVDIFGGGDLYTTGSITTTGSSSIFGSTNDCTAGPCSGRNLCGYTLTVATDQVICSTETPVALTASTNATGTKTFAWQRANSPGTFSNSVAGTPPLPTVVAIGSSNSTTYTIDPSYYASAGTDFFRAYVYDSNTGCGAFSNPVSLVALGATAWKGVTSDDWNTASNWCSNTPPSSTQSLSIEAFPPATTGRFMPVISSGTGNVRNLTIDAGASLTVSGTGTLDIYGNLTNNGSFTSSGSGTTRFVATNRTQTIGGASYTVFNNLTINNTHSDPTITASSNFAVNGTLTLTNGLINLNNNTLSVGISATDNGNVSRTNGWVYGGNLVKYSPAAAVTFGSGDDLLPIGTSADYRPLQVEHTALTTGGFVRVAHTGVVSSTVLTPTFNDTDAVPVQAISNSFWTVSSGGFSGGSAAPFRIRASGTGFGTVANLSHLRLVQANAAITGSSPGTNAGSLTNPTVERINVSIANITSGNLYFGTTNYVESPLPISLLYLNSDLVNNHVELSWATSEEEDFSHFLVQHSVNGTAYKDLAYIPGAGYNTESINEYSYTHEFPVIGTNYYRLKAVDLDGTFEYYGPVSERFSGEEALWIHPNPSTGDKVVYQTNFTPNENDRVLVYNQMGSVVADEPAIKNNGTVYFSESLKAGAYILKYSTGQQVLFARFIVVK
jgi:hypothetical protein